MSYNPLRVLLKVVTSEETKYLEKEISDRSYIPFEVESLYKESNVIAVTLYSFEYSKTNMASLKEANIIYKVLRSTHSCSSIDETSPASLLAFAKRHKRKAFKILGSLIHYLQEVTEDKYTGDESLQSMFNYIKQHNNLLNIKI